MNHIDEHTLELFVLGAKEVRGKKKSIEAHIKKCEGCRTLAVTMTKFYADAETQLKSQPQLAEHLERALIWPRTEVERAIEPFYSTSKTLVPALAPKTLLQHVFSYAKQNPVKFGVGLFAVVGLLAATVNFGSKSFFRDTNPAYAVLSEPNTALEVYNRDGEKLWQLFQPQIKHFIEADAKWRISHAAVADLNGDGRNEIITTLPLPTENGSTRTMRVYDADRKLVIEKKFENTAIDFLTNHYEANFEFRGILVGNFAGKEKMEIFASADNGRSPWFLARLDAKGQTLGRFWHFGQMGGYYAVDLDDNGRKEIILCGMNQVNDLQLAQFAVVAVLNPEQIIGDVEATATRGFRLGPSDAEIYYIQIPVSDMTKALGLEQTIRCISSTSERQLRFVASSSASDEFPNFEFIFSKDMRLQEVKYSDQDILLHARLKKEGKIHSTFDHNYLENLKKGIRYWDGKEWRKEVTKVRHPLTNSP